MEETQTLSLALCKAPHALNLSLPLHKMDLVYMVSKSFPTF